MLLLSSSCTPAAHLARASAACVPHADHMHTSMDTAYQPHANHICPLPVYCLPTQRNTMHATCPHMPAARLKRVHTARILCAGCMPRACLPQVHGVLSTCATHAHRMHARHMHARHMPSPAYRMATACSPMPILHACRIPTACLQHTHRMHAAFAYRPPAACVRHAYRMPCPPRAHQTYHMPTSGPPHAHCMRIACVPHAGRTSRLQA